MTSRLVVQESGAHGAILVYGGDFFVQPRSEWASAADQEMPYSVEHAMRAFAEANDHWLAQQGSN